MQNLIACEVLDFLGAKSSRPLLEKILLFLMLDYVDGDNFYEQLSDPMLGRKIYANLLVTVCTIDWMSEFNVRSTNKH